MKLINYSLFIIITIFAIRLFSQEHSIETTTLDTVYKYYETTVFKIKYPSNWTIDKSNKYFDLVLYDSIKNEKLCNIKLTSLLYAGHQTKFEENEAVKAEKARLKRSKDFVESKRFNNKTEYYKLTYLIAEANVPLNQITYYWFYKDYEFVLTYTYNSKTELNVGQQILKSFEIKN